MEHSIKVGPEPALQRFFFLLSFPKLGLLYLLIHLLSGRKQTDVNLV